MKRAYWTLPELASRWRCSERALRGRINRGTLPAIRFPGSRPWLVPVDVVEKLERRPEREVEALAGSASSS